MNDDNKKKRPKGVSFLYHVKQQEENPLFLIHNSKSEGSTSEHFGCSLQTCMAGEFVFF
jgi:hypothetical protein